MNTTATSIQTALEQNLELQREVVKRLLVLTQWKAKNRQAAQKLTESYRRCHRKLEQDATPLYEDRDDQFYSNLAKKNRKEQQQRQQQKKQEQPNSTAADNINNDPLVDTCITSVIASAQTRKCSGKKNMGQKQHKELALGASYKDPTCGSIPPPDDDGDAGSLKAHKKTALTPKQLKQQWGYNNSRKWNLHFFIDPLGSIPEPNADTQFRHSILEGMCDETARIFPLWGSLDVYNWSKDEIQCLDQAVEEVRQKQQQVEEESSSHSGTHSGGSSAVALSSRDTSFTVLDSQIDFVAVAQLFNSRIKPKSIKRDTTRVNVAVPRTAVECRNIYLYSVSAKIKKSSWTKEESMKLLELVHSYREEDNDYPPWDVVSLRLQANRTPWQCFTHFQTVLNPSLKGLPWTVKSDELLFKYVSSLGPRYLLNLAPAALNICREVLPNRSPKQVMARCTRSLLNPNFVHESWSEDEERKLVVLMKVYRDSANPIVKASVHFPHRAAKSVWDKWQRSLNPEFLTRPWTKEEDQKLLVVVERRQGGWVSNSAEIKEEFPSRRTKQLYNRWLDLIDEERLVNHRQASLRNKAAKTNIVSSCRETLLDPDDFVVRAKRKRGPNA